MDSKEERFRTVQLDGLVLLKVIKHCKENAPDPVTGQLLGLRVEDRLEVTNCFPYPQSDSEEDSEAYQVAMMKCLRTVNVDNNTVGWYQSAVLATYLKPDLLEAQYNYQKHIPSSVVLVYDPSRTTAGHLQLKAFRLTDSFMSLYEAGKFTHKIFAKAELTSGDILQEVPIKVHNSHLVHAFLYELREDKSMSCTVDRLHIEPGPHLEKQLGVLSASIDDFSKEQYQLQGYYRQLYKHRQDLIRLKERRQRENEQRAAQGKELLAEEDPSKLLKAPVMPSRLETFLVTGQMEQYCKEIATTTTQALNKLYVVEGLQKGSSTAKSSQAGVAAAASPKAGARSAASSSASAAPPGGLGLGGTPAKSSKA